MLVIEKEIKSPAILTEGLYFPMQNTINCPTCNRRLANNARRCPSCQRDLAEDRRRQAASLEIVVIGVFAMAKIFGLLMLMPGIIVNGLRGRYKDGTRGLIPAAIRDWQTWLISMPLIIPVVVFLLNVRDGKKSTLIAPETVTSVQLRGQSRIREMNDSKMVNSKDDKSSEIPLAIPVAKVVQANETILKKFTEIPVSYVVVGIATNDTLNVRSGPGANNELIDKLPNGYSNIRITGASVMNGTNEWVPIAFGNRSGWVGKQFLKSNFDEK